jgi:branched-subunit amino acid transport protein
VRTPEEIWVTVIALAIASAAIRAAGPIALGGRRLPPRVSGLIDMVAPALLTALIVVETVGGDQAIEIDPRLAGVAAAGGLLWFRRSATLTAIVLAAGLTALLRGI